MMDGKIIKYNYSKMVKERKERIAERLFFSSKDIISISDEHSVHKYDSLSFNSFSSFGVGVIV